ncbi:MULTISPECIES: efflux RND transporter periplasmic adaptor subunit [Sinorhizobium]|uniref:Efflux transporter periplasmic adaptor subunit n=2 Tax=Sinorhizobium TaxID=28105 RepID=A0A2S3YPD1_9HYPH|nr:MULTISPECIES: efflux RND transporter periplasmic adaptor subunit [Sinorhizobium]AUX76642.1 RND family efflux transporter protein [Sinorhizobium fredii]PDT42862.1 efflux transporter periplasmic adaptor subunit [Sinorhizobium sp. FG01]PDT54833.1 efflux transporter periplasmic adaptor subunit [Sinorhizobium sp. NG07B]POH31875.1 efflux transporter periplasmic adaptor subunit [Sinorhizobium americanum]POH32786.1 efflux transporter periplasmic adaptor subunit [Sinorhizobium americanum]
MKRKFLLTSIGLVAAAGGAAYAFIVEPSGVEAAAADPRVAPPLVSLVEAKRPETAQRSFTGTIAARVESNLGFRVPGKIIQRYVDVGEQIRAGQPLMRIDETDLRLALTAKRNAVVAARAVVVQAEADERRYAALVKGGLAATPQRYEQAKSALDTATAQLAAAEAEAKVAENEATYSLLVADSDGTVVETLGEPGQVVAAGQTVIRLAQAGPREALVWLPESLRPQIGEIAGASIYGNESRQDKARLRQISDAADPRTRTYEARWVLDGAAASAPLGATVTIKISNGSGQTHAAVPVGAVLDDGSRTGVWIFDEKSSTVHFRQVEIEHIGEEIAVVSSLKAGEPVVALGAHLLQDGAGVRTGVQKAEAAN